MKPARTLCRSFPYSASSRAEVLVLGSMPGARSLRDQQYYAHPQNLFWEIMGAVFGAGRDRPYPERLQILQQSRVALWDVVSQCRRAGSLDADIHRETVVPNDFAGLFAHCPRIHTVFFNGHAAEQLFRKRVLPDLPRRPAARSRLARLPSTSPAHAALTRKEKLARWRRALHTALAAHFVYLLQSGDGRIYTGYTTDLERRFQQHRSGRGAKFTRAFGACQLLYHETHPSQSAALKREAEIKRWSRREKEALFSEPEGSRIGAVGGEP